MPERYKTIVADPPWAIGRTGLAYMEADRSASDDGQEANDA